MRTILKIPVFTSLFFCLFNSTSLSAQSNCSTYFFPMNEGGSVTYSQFDGKDKYTGMQTIKLRSIETTGHKTNVSLHTTMYDKRTR